MKIFRLMKKNMFVINEKPEKPFLLVLFEHNESKMILYLFFISKYFVIKFRIFSLFDDDLQKHLRVHYILYISNIFQCNSFIKSLKEFVYKKKKKEIGEIYGAKISKEKMGKG